MKLLGRNARMFRCHVDPHIPPKSRLAFMMGDGQGQMPGEAIIADVGIMLRAKYREKDGSDMFRDFVIPWANIENVEMEAETLELATRKKNA